MVRYSKNCIATEHLRTFTKPPELQLDMFVNEASNAYNVDYAHYFGSPASQLEPTLDSSLSYTTFKSSKQLVGIIRISTFNPSSGTDAFLAAFRELLIDDLKHIDRLIIDLRDNGGGLSACVDGVVSMFTSYAKITTMRALMTPLNAKLLATQPFTGTGYPLLKQLHQ